MEGRTSNMPSRLLEIRERMCRDLGIVEDELPFVGELLQVKAKKVSGLEPSSVFLGASPVTCSSRSAITGKWLPG